MTDERKGGAGGGGDRGGFGPKKPKATFGDVMLGIPAGRGGEREERGGRGGPGGGRDSKGGGRRHEGGRGRDSQRPQAQPAGEAPAEGQQAAGAAAPEAGQAPGGEKRGGRGGRGGERRHDRSEHKEKKPQGPLVVVKRATGVVETRTLDAGAATEATPSPSGSAPEGGAEASGGAPAEVAHAAPVVKPAAHVPSSALYEEVPESQSFAEMFEQAEKADAGGAGRKHYRVGDKVSGKIFQLGADTAFVSLGGKSEAMIELRELKDDEGILRFGVGDVVEAHVVEAGAKGIILSRQISKGSASLGMLATARASGMPVEGLVLSVNKGGLEVAVGDVRAFCPAGQVDTRFVGKLDGFVGEKLKFRVMEIRDRNVVLSRRSLLEEEQKAQAAETRKNLAEGKVLKGKVISVRDFGAFVDLGGLEGMIPVSEMSHVRIGHPSEVVKVGDDVEVEVLRLEPPNPNSPDKAKHKERITLSMRSRMEDPWKAATAELKEGERLTGKVVRLQPFGAFVELRPGVDGLIHISALSSRRVAHPRDVVAVGQEVTVQVEKIDPAEKRIGLRLLSEEDAARPPEELAKEREEKVAAAAKLADGPRPRVGMIVTGKIDRIEQYGVFLAFPGGKGLVPASETGTDRGTDMKRAFQLDQELRAEILEIDANGKIRLSLTAAKRSEERADVEAWKQSQPKGGGGKGFGTFADLLKQRK